MLVVGLEQDGLLVVELLVLEALVVVVMVQTIQLEVLELQILVVVVEHQAIQALLYFPLAVLVDQVLLLFLTQPHKSL
jgi:hypothetical protein